MKIVYDSNGQPAGDGVRVTRISEGGQKFEVLVDAKAERYATLRLMGDAAIPVPAPVPAPEPIPAPTTGKVWMIEPIGGSGPYKDVWAAVDAGAKGGDTLLLKDGSHGALTIKTNKFAFDTELVIRAQNPHKAHVSGMMVSYGAKNVAFEDLTIYRTDAEMYLGYVQADASHIKFRRNKMQSVKDVSGFLNWTAAQWIATARAGLIFLGPNCEATDNDVNVVSLGIGGGDYCTTRGNKITNHSADGMRAGEYSIVENNWTENAFQVDGNHCDGFQAFAGPSGVLRGLRVIGNDIIEWTHGPHPLRASMQGIGCYDGFYDDMIVRNNRVKTRHWHGISIYGARNSIIDGNTVTDIDPASPEKPWIAFFPHKNGTPGSGNILTNNTAPQFGSKSGVVTDTGNRIA